MNILSRGLILVSLSLVGLASYAHGDVNPRALIKTNLGDIVLELDKGHAPISVANFVRYVEKDGYKNSIFHRVIAGFMLQAGGHTEDLAVMEENEAIYNEAKNGLRNVTGTIAMARSGDIDSATRQWFINAADNYFLDHQKDSCTRQAEVKQKAAAAKGLYKPLACKSYGYTVFGRVISGMDVVRNIEVVSTVVKNDFQNLPEKAIVIESIEILE